MTYLKWYKKLIIPLGLVIAVILCTPVFAEEKSTQKERKRNSKWATSIEKKGLPNFHKVSDELYRGAQPSAAGMRELKKMGIKTVVNLRMFNSDRDEIGDLKLDYEHIAMKAWHAEEKQVVYFLKIVADPERTPVFVHCKHGADRTGLMCAVYRIVVMEWTKAEAIEELKEGGFGFHSIWSNIPRFIEKIDISETGKSAGVN